MRLIDHFLFYLDPTKHDQQYTSDRWWISSSVSGTTHTDRRAVTHLLPNLFEPHSVDWRFTLFDQSRIWVSYGFTCKFIKLPTCPMGPICLTIHRFTFKQHYYTPFLPGPTLPTPLSPLTMSPWLLMERLQSYC